MLDSINCEKLFPPAFLNQRWNHDLQAVPQIEKVKIKLSKPEGMGFHMGKLEHIEKTDSLLYTTKELSLQACREFFHSQKSRKALQYVLTARYCSTPKACGNYQPSEDGNFDLSYIAEEALKIVD